MNATPSATGAGRDSGITALARAVQANAHIADARHAADLPLCIFLLQMREYYRWEQGLGYDVAIDRAALGAWLAARERQWKDLEAQPYAPLPWAGRRFDPLDADALNAELVPLGWAYVAAWDGAQRPLFALAALQRVESACGGRPELLECGDELARSLFAPPAALVGARTIVLRREALGRWLWERLEVVAQRPVQGPWRTLVEAFGLNDVRRFAAAKTELIEALMPMLEWHERGEHRVAQRLEPGWAALRLALRQRPADAKVRAVRDLLSDLETTLPMLLEQRATMALHGWFALLDGWRERFCPALHPAYAAWCDGDDGRALCQVTRDGARHFAALADELLALHRRDGADVAEAIAARLDAEDATLRAANAAR